VNRKFQYKAFISYSHKDKAVAEWLHRALETLKVPRYLVGQETAGGPVPAHLRPIFRDESELAVSANLSKSVTDAVAESEFLIVICSPNSVASAWVNQEIIEFKRQHGESKILAIIVDGEPFGSENEQPENECFPPALRFRLSADGTLGAERLEPMAADIRAQAGGKRAALLKLAATLLHVNLDELIQRDVQRRHRQLTAIASGATLGMIVMGWLTFTAMQATEEAVQQRSAAEDLVEFMLSDLRQRLEPVGRLDVLDAVGEKALSYYDDQEQAGLDADSLGRRARALHLIGEIDDIRGDSESALETFERAADSTRALLELAPNDTQRVYDHAQSEFWVGYVAWQRGEYETADQSFQEYLRLAQELVQADPDNMEWLAELGFAHGNLGTMATEQGQWQEAETAFMNALEVAKRIAATDPADPDLQNAVAMNHSWLSSTYMSEMRFADARAQNLLEISIYESILAKDAQNRTAQRQLLLAKRGRGQLALANGDLRTALQELLGAQSLVDELIAIEPDATTNLEQQAMIQRELADVYYFAGRHEESLHAASLAIIVSEDLLATDRTIIDWQVELIRSQAIVSRIYRHNDRLDEARELLFGALQSLVELRQGGLNSPRLQPLTGAINLELGDIEFSSGNIPEAKRFWGSAQEELYRSEESLTPLRITALIESFRRLNREEEADQYVRRLLESGYRHPEFVGNQFE
jgi:tetratricopeptide (TPR) repeat protein